MVRRPELVPVDVVWILPFLLIGAVLYTSVGHGGATVYLAILTLAGFAVPQLVTTVLALNILAASIAFVAFRAGGHLRGRLLLPFIVTSVPCAFLGGLVDLTGRTGQVILGTALLLAAVRFLALRRPPDLHVPAEGWPFYVGAPLLGAALGFLAGATGIGGGIFLSPVLVALGWASVRQAGNVAAAFIVLNSLSGLAARVATAPVDWGLLLPTAAVVAVGAVVGSLLGSRKLPGPALQVLLGVVLLAAAGRALLLG